MRKHNEEIDCRGIEIEKGVFSGCRKLPDCPVCKGKPLYSEPDKPMAPHPQMRNAWINEKNEILLKAIQDYTDEINEAENTLRVRKMDIETIMWELKWRTYSQKLK